MSISDARALSLAQNTKNLHRNKNNIVPAGMANALTMHDDDHDRTGERRRGGLQYLRQRGALINMSIRFPVEARSKWKRRRQAVSQAWSWMLASATGVYLRAWGLQKASNRL